MTRTKSSRALLSVVLAVLMVAAFMPALTYSSFAATAKKATKVTKTTHNGTRVYGKVGKKYVLKYKLSPSKLTSAAKKVVWKSSDSSVVKVYSTNTNRAAVKVKGVGTAKVTVYTKANKKAKATWTFKTKAAAAKVAATGVTVKANNTTADLTKTLTVGTELTATVAPANATGVTYQWYADGTAISGATSSQFTVTADQIGKTITVKATDDSKNTVESAKTAAVSEVKINTVTLDGTKADNVQAIGDTLTVKATDDKNAPISDTVLNNSVDVQWYRYTSADNGNKVEQAISGATGTTYKITDADAGSQIYAVVTPKTGVKVNSAEFTGGKAKTGMSGKVAKASNSISAVKIQINGKDAEASKTYDAGSVLTAVVTPTAAANAVDYQWYQNGYKINGATSATYTAATSGNYTVKITLKSTELTYGIASGAKTISDAAKVKASKEFSGVTITNVTAANDSTRTDKTATYKDDVLGVEVSGIAASNYTVEWHKITKDNYGVATDSVISGQTGTTYKVTDADENAQIYAVVNGTGTQYSDYTGKTSALTVSKKANTKSSATVAQTSDTTVTVSGLADTDKVQLQKRTVSGIGVESAWTDISGATSKTYELTTDDLAAIKAGTVNVRAKVTDASGNVTYTDAITLHQTVKTTPEPGEK